ncbi:MAG: aminoglycoside phosphotransferase family protein [Candidatus Falkowbacteria bacterium]|nr:aminoglycoside phosphotransferase family protein [Candidatus Falkowbacteria bacterium]
MAQKLSFQVTFATKRGKEESRLIVCTAHWHETRIKVFNSLNFLWENDFSDPKLTIPRPLFFSEYFNGCFYEGIEGISLLELIEKNDVKTLQSIIPLIAKWFAKLHSIKISSRTNKLEQSLITNVIPGKKQILDVIKERYPAMLADYKYIYGKLIKIENYHLAHLKKLSVTHGDAHPGNIIYITKGHLGVIDFTDLCLADPARDIGTFKQQLEYMCRKKITDETIPGKLFAIFLEHYLEYVKIKYTSDFDERVNLYYNWTTIRTATYFLTQGKLMLKAEYHQKAKKFIQQVKENLKNEN